MISKLANNFKILYALVIFSALTINMARESGAQEINSWWGSAKWFDWSDYRATTYGRALLARMEAGSLKLSGVEYDLEEDLGITTDPEPFRFFCLRLFVDRVAFRYYPEEEEHNFWGEKDNKLSEIEIPSGFVGFDVELIRHPFFRFGVNADFGLNKVIVRDRTSAHGNGSPIYLESDRPNTIGAHLTAIPVRIKDVPLIFEARAAFPLPVFEPKNRADLTEWELSGGVRPSIWEQSPFGHSTFSVSFQGGYKMVNLDVYFQERDAELHTRWSGPFMQIGVHF